MFNCQECLPRVGFGDSHLLVGIRFSFSEESIHQNTDFTTYCGPSSKMQDSLTSVEYSIIVYRILSIAGTAIVRLY